MGWREILAGENSQDDILFIPNILKTHPNKVEKDSFEDKKYKKDGNSRIEAQVEPAAKRCKPTDYKRLPKRADMPMTAEQRAILLMWLHSIGETKESEIKLVLHQFQSDPQARSWLLNKIATVSLFDYDKATTEAIINDQRFRV